ncbi:MAG: hypothetical protein ACM65M_20030 [Microcoleus sp.]
MLLASNSNHRAIELTIGQQLLKSLPTRILAANGPLDTLRPLESWG